MSKMKELKRDVTELLEVNKCSYLNEMKRLWPELDSKEAMILGVAHFLEVVDPKCMDKIKLIESELINMKYSGFSLPGDTENPEENMKIREAIESSFEAAMYHLTYLKKTLNG